MTALSDPSWSPNECIQSAISFTSDGGHLFRLGCYPSITHLIHDEFWRLHVGRVDVEVGGQLVRLRAAESKQARGRAHRGRGRAPRVFLGGHHRKRLENILRILQQFYIIT